MTAAPAGSGAMDASARLRTICLALPEAVEVEAWGDPTWRVRGRIFAMEKRGDKRLSVWLKAPPGAQEVLVAADPARFFVPPYVGPKGWIGLRLEAADWDEVCAHVRTSYRLVAPKRLARALTNLPRIRFGKPVSSHFPAAFQPQRIPVNL
jgi:hypothetical protein